MKRDGLIVRGLRGEVFVVATCMMCLMAACSLPLSSSKPPGQCELKDCNVDLADLESKIDESAKNQVFSPEQAEAKKNSLEEEWAKYKINAISCEDFLKKAAYLICP